MNRFFCFVLLLAKIRVVSIESTDKIKIGGIKFSSELIQITLSDLPPEESVLAEILSLLTRQQINLSFLCLDATSAGRVSFCMTTADYALAREFLEDLLQPLEICSENLTPVGTLTLFPHQSSLNILGLVLTLFGQNELPVYGMNSSISALAINTDYHRLDEAAERLKALFLLPENHAPFRQHPPVSTSDEQETSNQKDLIVETVATYWEPVIKIYGSNIKTDLVMTTLSFPVNRLTVLGEQLQEIENGSGRFEMAAIQQVDDHTLQFILLYESGHEQNSRKLLSDAAENFSLSMALHEPVELLYFHGPHFQDRFGVADAALTTLKKHDLRILVAGCSGTSIYLIAEEKKAMVIEEALETVFSVPK